MDTDAINEHESKLQKFYIVGHKKRATRLR